MDSEIEIIHWLRKRNYTHNFEVSANHKLVSDDIEGEFSPGEVKIEYTYRFEGDSNPEDMSIVYALKTGNGLKGILIDAYGVYSNELVDEFITQIPN